LPIRITAHGTGAHKTYRCPSQGSIAACRGSLGSDFIRGVDGTGPVIGTAEKFPRLVVANPVPSFANNRESLSVRQAAGVQRTYSAIPGSIPGLAAAACPRRELRDASSRGALPCLRRPLVVAVSPASGLIPRSRGVYSGRGGPVRYPRRQDVAAVFVWLCPDGLSQFVASRSNYGPKSLPPSTRSALRPQARQQPFFS
jgi:hypothetical protein